MKKLLKNKKYMVMLVIALIVITSAGVLANYESSASSDTTVSIAKPIIEVQSDATDSNINPNETKDYLFDVVNSKTENGKTYTNQVNLEYYITLVEEKQEGMEIKAKKLFVKGDNDTWTEVQPTADNPLKFGPFKMDYSTEQVKQSYKFTFENGFTTTAGTYTFHVELDATQV